MLRHLVEEAGYFALSEVEPEKSIAPVHHDKTQGNITAGAFTADSVGNIFVEGHEDQMLVQQVKHQVLVPTDPQSG